MPIDAICDYYIHKTDLTSFKQKLEIFAANFEICFTFKPIFHQNAKYLASGAGVGQCPRRQTFALEIPTCWYLKCENLRFPTPNLKFALAPTPNSDASQWNIGGVGSGVGSLRWACTFHFFCVDFICVG